MCRYNAVAIKTGVLSIVSDLGQKLDHTLQRIRQAERNSGRPAGAVKLLAVSKVQPLSAIQTLARLGQKDFGESYVQEALDKIRQIGDSDLCWHFIGHIQSNKTRDIAMHFSWVHSVDRLKIAKRLSAQRQPELPPLNVCLEVNLHSEASKSGFTAADLIPAAREIDRLPNLRLRGLMAIPRPETALEEQRKPFARLRYLMTQLKAAGIDVDTLSMGMSADLEAAISEGATWVRVGTDVFGPRPVVTR